MFAGLQTLKELCACLLSSGLDLNTVPIDMIRAVLDLRQRGAVALGNIVADYPTAQLTGPSHTTYFAKLTSSGWRHVQHPLPSKRCTSALTENRSLV